jgi:hypothetical protein
VRLAVVAHPHRGLPARFQALRQLDVSLPSGLRQRAAASAWPSTSMASIGRLRSRSSSMRSSGARVPKVSRTSPTMLRSAGWMRSLMSAFSKSSASWSAAALGAGAEV